MKNLIYFILGLALSLSLATNTVLAADVKDDRPSAPNFSLSTADGQHFTQNEMLGKTTLVIFWASWCGTCHQELPKVRALQEKWKDKAFQVIAIGFRDTEQNISHYVKKNPDVFSFPVFYDKDDTVSAQFGAMATPTLFLFDKEAKLVLPYRGGGLLEHPQFQKILAELL
ncbi:MAG: TlpA disulfide reductase family protein [Nitrospirota bacterium]|nr:TlpA disulfide reductase family protein [Nitrospirota bacterium]